MTEPGNESLKDPPAFTGGVAADGRGPIGLETREAYPQISQAIGLVIAAIVFDFLFDIPVWLLTSPRTEIRFIAMEVSRAVSIGLVIWWGYERTGLALRDVFPLKAFRLARLAPIVMMLLGAIILAVELNFVVQMAWPKPTSMKETNDGLIGGSIWLTFLAVVVVGPLTQELLFRGVILQGFLRNYNRRKAIIASALLFALFHLSPWQFPLAFLLGVVLGWWLVVTGSLLPCLLGHALANSLTLLVSVVGRDGNGPGGAASPSWPFWLVVGLLGTGLLAAGAWLERKLRVGVTT